MPRMNAPGMPMMASPIQVTANTANIVMIWAISQRSSVSPMRSTMTVARSRCLAGTNEQQSVAVDARLCREGEPEKQHDEEVADRAHGAEQELKVWLTIAPPLEASALGLGSRGPELPGVVLPGSDWPPPS